MEEKKSCCITDGRSAIARSSLVLLLKHTHKHTKALKLAPALHFTRSPSSLSLLPYSRAPPMDFYCTQILILVKIYKRTLIEVQL